MQKCMTQTELEPHGFDTIKEEAISILVEMLRFFVVLFFLTFSMNNSHLSTFNGVFFAKLFIMISYLI